LYGVVGGCGVGLLYAPSIVIVSRYFKDRHSIANGVVVSGTGLGTMLLGLFAHYVIDGMGWRGYMRVYGSLIFLLTCLTLLYKPVGNAKNSSLPAEETKEKPKTGNSLLSVRQLGVIVHIGTQDGPALKKKLVDWAIWKQASFLLYVVTTIFMVLGVTVPMVHLVHFARDINIVGSNAALLLTFMGIGSLAGRLCLGLFAANKQLKPTLLFGLCIGLAGLSMTIAPQIKTYAELCVFVVWLGYFIGGQTTLQAVVLRDLVGADRLSQALGWSMGLQAPAALGGPPIAGQVTIPGLSTLVGLLW
jgi:MFS family permease